jgi:ABC-2 type transport system ATP-binding protein
MARIAPRQASVSIDCDACARRVEYNLGRSVALPSPSSESVLVAASEIRVDANGVAVLDGITLTSTGEWVLMLGAPRALFEAAAGLRAVMRGTLRVAGVVAADAARTGVATGAPLDPPLPPRWTVREYVTWSARLSGHARGAAEALATQAIERLDLGQYASARLGPVAVPIRRGTVLAAALASDARVLLIEDPTVGLADDVAHAFARRIARAVEGRRVIFFAARIPLESPLALAADEAFVLRGSQLAAQGAPAEIAAAERSFSLAVAGDVRAFASALVAEGASLLAPIPDEAASKGGARLAVRLGPLGTSDVLRIAASHQATVVELRPIAAAFA